MSAVVHRIAPEEDSAANHGQTRAEALREMLSTRVLPDYTWPTRVPLAQLRHLIELECREAAEMADEALRTARQAP